MTAPDILDLAVAHAGEDGNQDGDGDQANEGGGDSQQGVEGQLGSGPDEEN